MKEWLFIFFFFWGCNTGQQKKIDENIKEFRTTDASLLFFKNLRSPYYEPIENNDESTLSFIIRDRYRGSERIVCQSFINLHRYEDRASITLQLNRNIEADTEGLIIWNSSSSGDQGKIPFNLNDKDHSRPAFAIYNHLLSGDKLFLNIGDINIEILSTCEDQESFRITLIDFLRLIEAY